MGIPIEEFIYGFNFLLFLLFGFMYLYQIIYLLYSFKVKKRKSSFNHTVPFHKYAVIIAARNEELVIGQLIQSIKKQKYPKEMIDIFVVADNCTDRTAEVAQKAGAIVRERFNKELVGKGYALDFMFHIIEQEFFEEKYEGYFVFDADNLLEEDYVLEMNRTFHDGYRIITSYRNSKNFGQNWISSGYSLWFLHEAEHLNLARMNLNTSCAISGTGFLVHADIIKANGGWGHHLLTEDIEFSVAQIAKGEKIGYCRNAMFYDEQPVTFRQSWNQRMRWAKGFYQVFAKYGKTMIKNIFTKGNHHRFSCYDMTMMILPAMLVSFFSILVNMAFLIAGVTGIIDDREVIPVTIATILRFLCWYYGILYLLGLATVLTEWKRIHSTSWKKIFYTFTFPLFMFTYIPIAVVALFQKVEWKPIAHTVAKSLDDVR
ncbi:glycosyltransferase [Oceanobacillus luteolus]|uniref:glycosyltransferase family 2 protein n=1 Tax=Oceanobacillus luteolus TaxID=1274358 RepID=UPI00203AF9C3|nr:glycosyltransferase family 2 protein [Oceanobacillus luteolus]MCM3741385.1 glycosyltransferase [Oceanobacillus luteolus]